MDTDRFNIHIKTEDFYKDIVNDVEKQFDTQTKVKMAKDHFQQVGTRK